jgi:hypothetical protein
MRLAIQIYQRVLLSSEKVKIFHLGKKKKLHAEVAMIYCKNESSVQKFGRKEKGIHSEERKKEFMIVLLLHLRLQKLQS